MFVKKRPWLRFIEGTDGAAGSAEPVEGSEADNGDEKPDEGKSEKSDDESDEESLKARIAELEKERDTWKGHARTWESRAKKSGENADSSDVETRLNDLEEQLRQKDEDLKKSKRSELRARAVAKFDVAEDDIEFLPDSDDEELVFKHAERLATPSKSRGAEDPYQGRGSGKSSREAMIERAKKIKM